ncbi:uncharacterized protein LOC109610097 [Camponotus floridanus]|uniref:uncharacterized protein LOC109610097 n=1 Tax=Camponotus floridanus TaxID=104421 RepID=UPI000DC6960F|nr:uncharacterized protein LOC109610097 [Camponotus floridanus]
MIDLEIQHFKLNRYLLLIVGLWPLQQSNLTRLQFVILSSTIMTIIILQLMTLITLNCTTDLINVLCSICFIAGIWAAKYNSFYLNMEAMKDLLVQLRNICNGLEDKNEIAIMKKYSCNANRYTTVLAILGICGIFIVTISMHWSRILYIILNVNISLSHHLPIKIEYFIDQDKYFYLIQLHIIMLLCIGITVTVAIGAMLITFTQYFCGMFRISSYRIKRAVHIDVLENIKAKKENVTLKGIICAVNIHRQAMKLCRLLETTINPMFFSLITTGVVSLSLSFFQIFQIISIGGNIKEFIFPIIIMLVIMIYMFLANYLAQDITDHNNDIFVSVYNVQWNVAPLHIQKVILFLLQRGTKDFTVCAGGLFVGSLECFATLVKASVSYFTVISSAQL